MKATLKSEALLFVQDQNLNFYFFFFFRYHSFEQSELWYLCKKICRCMCHLLGCVSNGKSYFCKRKFWLKVSKESTLLQCFELTTSRGLYVLILTQYDLGCLNNGLSLLGSFHLYFFNQHFLKKIFYIVE